MCIYMCVCVCVLFNQTNLEKKMLPRYRRLTMHLFDTSSIAQHLKKHSCPTTQLRKILTDNTTILEHQNNKQKLQILEALHIRNMQPTLNRINFQTSANVLKCLYLLTLIIETHLKADAIIFNGKDALT